MEKPGVRSSDAGPVWREGLPSGRVVRSVRRDGGVFLGLFLGLVAHAGAASGTNCATNECARRSGDRATDHGAGHGTSRAARTRAGLVVTLGGLAGNRAADPADGPA